MEKIHMLAFRSIQIRSQITEALCIYASERRADRRIMDVAWRSSDVTEHIAQYALEGVSHNAQATYLVQDLKTALYILTEFEDELQQSQRYVPGADEISQVINELTFISGKPG